VLAVQWETGRLDARSNVRFGAWTIQFGTLVRYAVYIKSIGSITIGGDNPLTERISGEMHCFNAALGERYCTLDFNWPVAGKPCIISIWGEPIGSQSFRYENKLDVSIPCPTALDLVQ
jgi:hypothetical protein